MLRIRDEQVHALRDSLTSAVEDELFADVKKFFEERHTYLGDGPTRAAVRYGIERAGGHGFRSKRGLALYVTLMFVLGSHFDENPLYPWVQKNLFADREVDEYTRSHRFYNALRRYLRATRDESGVYLEPIVYFPGTPPQPSSHALSGAALEEHLVALLRTIAPAHFEVAGEDRVRALVRDGVERARAHGLTTAAGLSIYVPLTFLLGTGFDKDLQFPWAAEALKTREGEDPETAAMRLREAALAFRLHASTFAAS
jgi:hypothetical protein